MIDNYDEDKYYVCFPDDNQLSLLRIDNIITNLSNKYSAKLGDFQHVARKYMYVEYNYGKCMDIQYIETQDIRICLKFVFRSHESEHDIKLDSIFDLIEFIKFVIEIEGDDKYD